MRIDFSGGVQICLWWLALFSNRDGGPLPWPHFSIVSFSAVVLAQNMKLISVLRGDAHSVFGFRLRRYPIEWRKSAGFRCVARCAAHCVSRCAAHTMSYGAARHICHCAAHTIARPPLPACPLAHCTAPSSALYAAHTRSAAHPLTRPPCTAQRAARSGHTGDETCQSSQSHKARAVPARQH